MHHTIALSILIPVFRRDCRPLLEELQAQAKKLSVGYEIILGDDCSGEPFTSVYATYQQEGLCRVFTPHQNMGAGRLRNALAQEAQGDQLLILDSDTMPASANFLARYLQQASADEAVCGGFIYPPTLDNPLRRRYGECVESKPAVERAKAPHAGFISMAFMIPRATMLATGFPPNMGMGYEDLLFGEHLRQAGVALRHIDNPVEHHNCDTPAEFLSTTRRYIDNLHRHQEELGSLVRLARAYRKLHNWHLAGVAAALWPPLRPLLERQLTGAHPSLRLFNLYKLLYLASISSPRKG